MEVQRTIGSTINTYIKHDKNTINEESKQFITDSEKVDRKGLEKIIEGVNNLIPSHTSSKFVFHEKLNDYYVQVVDDQTNEVVREIPSKKFLDMYADMLDFMGIFVNRKI
ncbi:flagellar protein FlaG [Fictibacillus sp. S7]|uniref:flagellar protein FlaG n=1 Tax=Fictibacillus sp. S7 TaxID=2212476 RepID=UPI00101140E3|nr:flagellar protein FlaG [Fictibacillus sp. S7]RXZ01854.1 flagellar biosynthesis protein FlaG [Fictibacillus sp. S7]